MVVALADCAGDMITPSTRIMLERANIVRDSGANTMQMRRTEVDCSEPQQQQVVNVDSFILQKARIVWDILRVN